MSENEKKKEEGGIRKWRVIREIEDQRKRKNLQCELGFVLKWTKGLVKKKGV